MYKTCKTECLLGTTDFDAVLIGLSDLYEQVRPQLLMLQTGRAYAALKQCTYHHLRSNVNSQGLLHTCCHAYAQETPLLAETIRVGCTALQQTAVYRAHSFIHSAVL